MVLTVTADGGTVTIGEVYNGDTKLIKDTDYTVTAATGKVTLKATYLDDLEAGDYTITIETSQGNVNAVITVADTTTLTADPAAATFDKNTSNAEGYVDVEIEVKHNTTGVTLTSVKNGDAALTAGTDYTAVGLVVTLLKTYLETLTEDDYTITIETSQGNVNAVITVVDTTDEV